MDTKRRFDDIEDERIAEKRRKFWSLSCSLCLIVAWGIWRLCTDANTLRTADFRSQGTEKMWPWDEIKSLKTLEWNKCHSRFDCARLDVPLDWLDPSEDLRASIALIRYNATDRRNYKGSVIINPGGPGGSGIWFVKRLAKYYQTVVGRSYDIIGFDPRGVGASIPRVTCFSSPQSSVIWNFQSTPVLDAHPGVIYDAYARAFAYSQACVSSIDSNSSAPGRFMSTPYTARDILAIAEALGEKKVQYWGFSYGSFLGLTFASLFSDKVERMVLDGNVDAFEYSHAKGTHFLQDTEKVAHYFYTTCHSAGPKKCSFYASTPSLIESRLETILLNIKKHPVIIPGSAAGVRPDIVSYSTVRHVISSSLYRPLEMFPLLSNALVALENGNGLPFLQLSGDRYEDSLLCSSNTHKGIGEGGGSDDPPGNVPPEDEDSEGNVDASLAIFCSDNGGWPMNATVDDFASFVVELEARSKSAGATMASLALGCVGWSATTKWRFTGPFKGNTSAPILFVSNIADNVTPLWSAQRNSEGFPGSEILVQNAYGHTTLASPSICTSRYIQKYFQTGTLPPKNTACESDYTPFDDIDEILYAKSSSKQTNLESDGHEGSEEGEVAVSAALVQLMRAPVLKWAA